MIRKDVVIAIIATFCLTASMFMVTTSKSQSGVGEYNPWADYNDDGVIDIFDIVPGAVSFGAEGDSTKNVNVTNWPLQSSSRTTIVCQNYTVINNGPTNSIMLPFSASVDGYKYVSIFMTYLARPDQGSDSADLLCYFNCSGIMNANDFTRLDINRGSYAWVTAAGSMRNDINGPEIAFGLDINSYPGIGERYELSIVIYCYN